VKDAQGELFTEEAAAPDSGGDALEGTLERVVYTNPDTRWTVARLRVPGRAALATIVGNLVEVPPGMALRLRGEWVSDARYGEQFRVRTYVTLTPSTLEGIERYLGSGLVAGIGPVLAARIVAQFGAQTLDVIEQHPDRLAEVPGIGGARAERLQKAWHEQRAVADVMLFLQGLGVSPAFAARIYKRYGEGAIDVVRQDPYRLALEVWGIGFKTADAIAERLGVARDSPRRAEAGVLHLVHTLAEDGHTFVPADELVSQACEVLGIDTLIVEQAVRDLGEARYVIAEELPGRGRAIYSPELYAAEIGAADHLARLLTSPAPPLGFDPEGALARFEETTGMQLAPGQRDAVRAAITSKVAVITGGPGVGKTTVVRALLDVLERAGRLVALAAPTGRAAKRMAEATGHPASTLHRMLEWSPHSATFKRGADNPLPCDALIVDEASMLDIHMAERVASALRSRARLILVGDIDQLPAVGPGTVLADVIASRQAAVARMTEIFRQAAASQIVTNAHRVNQGELPSAQGGDYFFIARDDPEAALATLQEVVTERIPKRFGLDPIDDVQVLAPMHRGVVGAANLNEVLQRTLNPTGTSVTRGARTFRTGDKVMQVKNDYDKDVFNGDIGRIVAVGGGEQAEVLVEFDGRRVSYPLEELDQLVHAYAVTVHKAQGSEYPAVVIPLMTQHYMMLQRSLLYTAITRGKRLVVVIGQPRALAMAVRSQDAKIRMSALADRLTRAVENAQGP